MSRPPHGPSSRQDASEDWLAPAEGWHVLHLFYQVDYTQWSLLTEDEQLEAKTELTRLAQEIRSTADTQLLTFSMVTPKADVGFMLLTPDLHTANAFEKQLSRSLGPDILAPSFSYLSLTERGEYAQTPEEFAATLAADRGLAEGSGEFAAAMGEFEERTARVADDRLYPSMPDWPVFCFYSMAHRRGETDNWYQLDLGTRRQLMEEHGRTSGRWEGKIRHLTTGSIGLDDSEWGVTLFAKGTSDVKQLLYEMRFDKAAAKYGEFGDFYIGIQLPLDGLFRRVGL